MYVRLFLHRHHVPCISKLSKLLISYCQAKSMGRKSAAVKMWPLFAPYQINDFAAHSQPRLVSMPLRNSRSTMTSANVPASLQQKEFYRTRLLFI